MTLIYFLSCCLYCLPERRFLDQSVATGVFDLIGRGVVIAKIMAKLAQHPLPSGLYLNIIDVNRLFVKTWFPVDQELALLTRAST